ncbi:hypothetical protein C8Q77DRAFT_1103645 [Trametes polyzona]|nr:hypothetical protein C8Q77DRAFT_1103645 [Trametes polyzona]
MVSILVAPGSTFYTMYLLPTVPSLLAYRQSDMRHSTLSTSRLVEDRSVHKEPVLPSPPPYSARRYSRSEAQLSPPPSAHFYAPPPFNAPALAFPDEEGAKGWKSHMHNFAPGKSPGKLLEPPPPSFTRPPPSSLTYDDFPDLVLFGKGTMLDQGFPYIAPFCPTAPHPFVTHDVNEHDWRQFLHDIRIAGSLSPTNRIISGVLPMAFGLTIILGLMATHGIDNHMRRKKKGPVSQLIDHWNNLFFHPRLIHIALEQGPRDRHSRRGPPQLIDKNWRLVISYYQEGIW